MNRGLSWAACILSLCPWTGVPVQEEDVTRETVLGRLDGRAAKLLEEVESKTGLRVVFAPMPRGSYVIAQFGFDPAGQRPTVSLGPGWRSHDAAHELMHMKLELVEGFRVLAWRRGVERSAKVEAAFGRVRSYVDDQVVHARLARLGYKLDGEVLSPVLFDDLYTKVPRYLDEGRARPDDGMAHLDAAGYGDLCRASFLVQAELVAQIGPDGLPEGRLKLARRFIASFRARRAREAERADRILALFKEHDVQAPAGHQRILGGWSELEGLDKHVGLSAYVKEGGKYLLPWP